MATSTASKRLVSDLVSSLSHPSNYVRAVSNRPNLSHAESSGDSIPLIDLRELHGPNRAEIVHQLANACSTYGFFQLKNDGVAGKKMPLSLVEGKNYVDVIARSRVYPDKKSTVVNLKLSLSDLDVVSSHYIQKGCFITCPNLPPQALLSHFKHSLSRTLSHFPSLAGRLSTSDDGYVFLSCNDAGADFVFADAKSVHVSDVFAGIDVPDVVKEFFSYDRAVSYEGHNRPILAVQVTELIDGVFIGCSVNQAVADGTSLWNFINTFSEMSRWDEILTRPAEVLPPPSLSSPSRLPQRQQSNSFLNLAPLHPLNLTNQVPEPHQMDTFSWAALVYCFNAGLEFNSIFAQVAADPNNVSFRVQLLSVLLLISLCLLLAANAIFARTHPRMAFIMDRVGSVITLISSIIAATPTLSEYVSIGCAVFMIIVYAHQYFKNN